MAIVPLLQGFTHMDVSRMERMFNFGPFIRSISAPRSQ